VSLKSNSVSIQPALRVDGIVRLPADPLISCCHAVLGLLSQGTTTIHNYSPAPVARRALDAVQVLGARLEEPVADPTSDLAKEQLPGTVLIHSEGLRQDAVTLPAPLKAGDSAELAALLAGVLVGRRTIGEIGTDGEIRPGTEIADALDALHHLGARYEIGGRRIRILENGLGPLPSARLAPERASLPAKLAVLAAGLHSAGEVTLREPVRSPDHFEIGLREFGTGIEFRNRALHLPPQTVLTGRETLVPGDLSSAIFFVALALLHRESTLALQRVGLNPTRTLMLDLLATLGPSIKIIEIQQVAGELVGDLRIRTGRAPASFRGGLIEGELAANLGISGLSSFGLMGMLPILAVLGATSPLGLTIRDTPLKSVDSARLERFAGNFRRMGGQITVAGDGLTVAGGQRLRAATMDAEGDPALAMTLAIAASVADGPCEISGTEGVAEVFPLFFSTLEELTRS
jgi:3-phosphoshikimate 1-carboxyvinyltransferase